jgi:hypothetical protein
LFDFRPHGRLTADPAIVYREGVIVPLFAFGHGLPYTSLPATFTISRS